MTSQQVTGWGVASAAVLGAVAAAAGAVAAIAGAVTAIRIARRVPGPPDSGTG